MADKNIGQFTSGDYADITHVIGIPAQGPTAEVDPMPVPKAAFKGDKGDKGDKGNDGLPGANGAKGDPGLPGTPGTNGTNGTNGDPGPRGEKGDVGPSMIPDGYGIFDEAKVTAVETAAVDYNYLIIAEGDQRVNKTVPAALNGDMSGHLIRYDAADGWFDFGPIVGIPGPKGDVGETGGPGEPGRDGVNGTNGAKGDTGDKGDRGNDGLPGLDGDPGPRGEKGDKGDKGDPGVVPTTTLKTVAGTSHTLVLEDAEKYHRFTSADAKTVLVPAAATANFPFAAEGQTTTIAGINAGAGTLEIAPAAGVTLNCKYATSVAQWGAFVLTKVGANEWDVSGDMGA